MADHSPPHPDAAPRHELDYALDDELVLTEPAQYRALFDDTRARIISVLNERAATTQEVAQVLGRPKGTIGHHLKVLEAAGLIRVVRTKRVRALEAKYYGRTARVFLYHHVHEAAGHPTRILEQAASEAATAPAGALTNANIRHVRIPAERAEEWSQRLNDLLSEFADQPRDGDTVYGFAFALYATDRAAFGQPADGGPEADGSEAGP